MKYLLDTNILIWFSEKSQYLPEKFRDIIIDPDNISVVSIVSCWEIGIKYSINKLTLHKPLELFFEELQQTDFIEILDLKPSDIVQQSKLPFHHRDPFDRLIYAQAISEDLTFLYTDEIFDEYKKGEQK